MVKVKPIVKDSDGKLDTLHSMLALQARGKTGSSGGFGFIRFGYSRFGATNHAGGILQKRVTGYNQYGRNPNRPRRAYYVRMRPYRPTNPQTPAQQANRAKMADAVSAWNSLTPVEKSGYNKRGKRANKIGRNLFISWYLKNH